MAASTNHHSPDDSGSGLDSVLDKVVARLPNNVDTRVRLCRALLSLGPLNPGGRAIPTDASKPGDDKTCGLLAEQLCHALDAATHTARSAVYASISLDHERRHVQPKGTTTTAIHGDDAMHEEKQDGMEDSEQGEIRG